MKEKKSIYNKNDLDPKDLEHFEELFFKIHGFALENDIILNFVVSNFESNNETYQIFELSTNNYVTNLDEEMMFGNIFSILDKI